MKKEQSKARSRTKTFAEGVRAKKQNKEEQRKGTRRKFRASRAEDKNTTEEQRRAEQRTNEVKVSTQRCPSVLYKHDLQDKDEETKPGKEHSRKEKRRTRNKAEAKIRRRKGEQAEQSK